MLARYTDRLVYRQAMESIMTLDVVSFEITRETIPVGTGTAKELAIGQLKARIFVRSPVTKTVYALDMPAELAEEFRTLELAKAARVAT